MRAVNYKLVLQLRVAALQASHDVWAVDALELGYDLYLGSHGQSKGRWNACLRCRIDLFRRLSAAVEQYGRRFHVQNRRPVQFGEIIIRLFSCIKPAHIRKPQVSHLILEGIKLLEER